MEFLWTLAAIAPIALILVVCRRVLAVRWRLPTLSSGFFCGAATGLYLFALGQFAFRYSLSAWLPGALFHLHTFALAMISLAADRLSGGGDAMVVQAMDRSRSIRLVWGASLCVLGYGILGMLIAQLVASVSRRLNEPE